MRAFEAVPAKKRTAWCRRHFVSFKALRNAERVQEQLQVRYIRKKSRYLKLSIPRITALRLGI